MIFNRLSRRERLVLLVGGVVLIGFGLWGLSNLSQWYWDGRETLDRLIQQKLSDRVTLVRLHREYDLLKKGIDKFESRITRDKKGFSLLSYLESLSGKLAMRSHITHMRPQPPVDLDGYREISVEIKMEKISLKQIARLLSTIEESPHLIRIKRLRLRKQFSDPSMMNATFLATTYEPGGTK